MTIGNTASASSRLKDESVLRTDLDRAAEERSENEGMAEHADKALDPIAWEEGRILRSNGGDYILSTLPEERDEVGRAPVETTELERRVLVLERILQALIAHMAETEPKFLRRLADIFCLPLQMVHCEHDYTDTDAYAAEFIRTVVRLGDKPAGRSPDTVRSRKSPGVAPSGDTGKEPNFIAPPRIRMRHAGGVWRVTKDGRFHGDFSKKEDALAAVEAAGSGTAQSP